MLLVLMGPPGVGKGTQAALIAAEYGLTNISTGVIFRKEISEQTEFGKIAAGYIDEGHLVPDELILEMVFDRISQPDCEKGCLLDGFPRTVPQAIALDEKLQASGKQMGCVLRLIAKKSELRRRLLDRADKEGRADDTPATIEERFVVYKKQTEPLVDYYMDQSNLVPIDGMGTPEEVFQRIQKILSGVFQA